MSRILIVDDDRDVRRVLRRVMEADGHTVVECPDGRDALRAMTEEQPDLVITDVYMPEMDGIEFLTRLREEDPDLPVLAVSGGSLATADFVLEDASKLGADAVLSKPFDIDEVRHTVRKMLAGSGFGV